MRRGKVGGSRLFHPFGAGAGKVGGSRLFHPFPLPKLKAAAHTHPESDVVNLVSDLAACEKTANKGVASGYCPLDASGKVPSGNLNLTGYEQTVNKGAASGYCPLDASAKVPAANLNLTGYEQTVNKGAASGYCPLDANAKVPAANLDINLTGYEQTVNKGAASGYCPLDASAKVPASNLNLTGYEQTVNKGAASGYCPLDSGAKVPAANLDLSAYEQKANKGAASGYCPLDSGTKVPTANLGSGTADSTTFLRGDRTWATVSGSSATKAVCVIDFCACDWSPSATGVDPVEKIVPYLGNGSAGGRSATWVFRRLTFRCAGQPTTSPSINVQKSTSSGVFSGTDILSSALSVSTTANEATATSFNVTTCASGDKLALNVVAIGAGTLGWAVQLMMEEQ